MYIPPPPPHLMNGNLYLLGFVQDSFYRLNVSVSLNSRQSPSPRSVVTGGEGTSGR